MSNLPIRQAELRSALQTVRRFVHSPACREAHVRSPPKQHGAAQRPASTSATSSMHRARRATSLAAAESLALPTIVSRATWNLAPARQRSSAVRGFEHQFDAGLIRIQRFGLSDPKRGQANPALPAQCVLNSPMRSAAIFNLAVFGRGKVTALRATSGSRHWERRNSQPIREVRSATRTKTILNQHHVFAVRGNLERNRRIEGIRVGLPQGFPVMWRLS